MMGLWPLLLNALRVLSIRLVIWYALQKRESILRYAGVAFLIVLAAIGWNWLVLGVLLGFLLLLTHSKDSE